MKKFYMLFAALCIFVLSGYAQINIWRGSKLIYSAQESEVDSVTFGERPVSKDLSFDLMVRDINSVFVNITVTPSDERAEYVWLCQPTSTYPGKNFQEIANAYVETFKGMLDKGMGLYKGTQKVPKFKTVPKTEYFLIAFGYDQVITTKVAGTKFTTKSGNDIEKFDCEITFPEIQGERVTFNVKPNDSTMYYYCNLFPKSEFNEDIARKSVEDIIKQTHESNLSWNPNYPIEQVVENLCYVGEGSGSISPLEASSDYTFYAVAVSSKGEVANKIVTKDFRTLEIKYSDATVSSEFLGAFDFQELKAAGYFTEGNYDENTIVMAYKLNTNEYCDKVKFKLWNGTTDATDTELMGYIGDTWNGEKTKEQLKTDFIVFITFFYDNDATFLTIAYDKDGVNSKIGREYTDKVVKGKTNTVKEFEDILKLLPETVSARKINVINTPVK